MANEPEEKPEPAASGFSFPSLGMARVACAKWQF